MNIKVPLALFQEMLSCLQSYKYNEPIAVCGKDIVESTIKRAEKLLKPQLKSSRKKA
jgi:hypothetical protein